MAPELLKGKEYGPAADVFSYGIVLCEMIGRIDADPDVMPRRGNFAVDEEAFRASFGQGCPPPLLALAYQCAALNPEVGPPQ